MNTVDPQQRAISYKSTKPRLQFQVNESKLDTF